MLAVAPVGMRLTWLAPQLTWLKLALFRLNRRAPVPVPGVCVQWQNGVAPCGIVCWLGVAPCGVVCWLEVSSTKLFRKCEEAPVVYWFARLVVPLVPV